MNADNPTGLTALVYVAKILNSVAPIGYLHPFFLKVDAERESYYKKRLEIAKLLLDHGAIASLDDDLALFYSLWDRNMTELLLANGANVHAHNDRALEMAVISFPALLAYCSWKDIHRYLQFDCKWHTRTRILCQNLVSEEKTAIYKTIQVLWDEVSRISENDYDILDGRSPLVLVVLQAVTLREIELTELSIASSMRTDPVFDLVVTKEQEDCCNAFFVHVDENGCIDKIASKFLQTNCDEPYFTLTAEEILPSRKVIEEDFFEEYKDDDMREVSHVWWEAVGCF